MKNSIKDFYTITHNMVFHPEFLIFYVKRKALKNEKKYASGILIDIGCGKMPYRDIFISQVEKYIGMDYPKSAAVSTTLAGNLDIQLIGQGEKLPTRNNSIDTFLLLDVLEHTDRYNAVLGEVHRSLKKNGKVILTTPFLYPLHMEPLDFFRYTKYGLEKVAEKAGFTVRHINDYGEFWHSIGLLLNNYLFFEAVGFNRLIKLDTEIIAKIILALLFPFFLIIFTAVNLLSLCLGSFGKSQGYPLGYITVLEKQ